MIHIFKSGNLRHPVLLLLHGTGGNEHDLLPLAETIDPDAAVLSVRGDVDENGMARFFKRLREGVFDEADLIYRTKNMISFIKEAAVRYDFDVGHVIAIGYSNGANLAASMLFHDQKALNAAILMHPMVPLKHIALPDLADVSVLITSGINDPIVPKSESQMLFKMLNDASATVSIEWFEQGHQISREEVITAKEWYDTTMKNS